ncbi:MAG: hypothetical protein ACFFCW_46600 [Candidatus Hodarchaeota archaeon]
MEKSRIRLAIPEWIVKRWCLVCYLIINWKIEDLVKQIQVEPSSEFYRVAAEYLYEYAHNNKMPPDEIAPAIINLGEDYLAGKPVQFRPGDYILIQNYIRKHKK